MQIVKTFLSILVFVLLSACVSTSVKESTLGTIDVSPEMVLNSSPLGEGTENLDLSSVDILEMTPEMIEFVESFMEGSTNRYRRIQRLL
mgnify:FL=1